MEDFPEEVSLESDPGGSGTGGTTRQEDGRAQETLRVTGVRGSWEMSVEKLKEARAASSCFSASAHTLLPAPGRLSHFPSCLLSALVPTYMPLPWEAFPDLVRSSQQHMARLPSIYRSL